MQQYDTVGCCHSDSLGGHLREGFPPPHSTQGFWVLLLLKKSKQADWSTLHCTSSPSQILDFCHLETFRLIQHKHYSFRRLFSPLQAPWLMFSTYFWSTAHAKTCAQPSTEQCVFGVVFQQGRTWILRSSCHTADNEICISLPSREQDQNGIMFCSCPVLLLFSSHTACFYPVRLPTNTTKRPPKLKHIMLKKLPTNLNRK